VRLHFKVIAKQPPSFSSSSLTFFSPLQTFVQDLSFSFSLTLIGMVADDHLSTSFPRRVQHGVFLISVSPDIERPCAPGL
jgi:hypothetical protein